MISGQNDGKVIFSLLNSDSPFIIIFNIKTFMIHHVILILTIALLFYKESLFVVFRS
jgi:hypothetical protein